MKKNKSKIILIIILTLCLTTILINNVNADMGQKPSITIKLKNMTTDNYLIDLLVYDETGKNYDSPMCYNGNGEQYSSSHNDLKTITVEQLETLHEINYDGWISESTRWDAYLLFADCSGNSKYEHNFSYFGTPDKYKILIINNDTGEIKISDEIIREDFTSYITFDYKTNTISKSSINIIKIIRALIITMIIELIIALIMNLKNNIKLIVIINIITNLALQLLLNIIPIGSYIISFAIMEIIIIVLEYLIYKKYIKGESNNKILFYTLIANLVTALLTFFIR